MRLFIDSIMSKAYWKYALFSRAGVGSVFTVFGILWLIVETLDFFKVYTQDRYPSYTFSLLLLVSIVITIYFRRPINHICVPSPSSDLAIEVRIGDIFEEDGAVMISTNTTFEADVASGKIALNSLQGQFTTKYFAGDQNTLTEQINKALKRSSGKVLLSPMGTTITITTHGKTFYFTAMAELNGQGNASTTIDNVLMALKKLWEHVRTSGELQKLVVPVVGTGRGRLSISRKKMIGLIAESFVNASKQGKFVDRLVVIVNPEDAKNYEINLYDVRDYLVHVLQS